jgi:hypothetical protein
MKRTPDSSIIVSCLMLASLLGARPLEQQPQESSPKIFLNVIDGEGRLNDIKQRVNKEPIVQVEDENHKPIQGAAVIFFLPAIGPSGTFANGSQSLAVTTDSLGRAAATGIHPNRLTGKLQIRVTASAHGFSSTTLITQMNVAGATGGGISTTVKVLIVVAIAAGAVAGIVVATHGGSKTPTQTTTSPVTITPGNPTVGAPPQ